MLSNATILLIRHAEKRGNPGKDGHVFRKLSPAGRRRAQAYIDYFQTYRATPTNGSAGEPVALTHLFAAKDTRNSHRCRLTLEPLANATGLELHHGADHRCGAELVRKLTADKYDGARVLVCWHHGSIVHLANAMLAPGGGTEPVPPPICRWPTDWPGDVFGWLMQIRYDADGRPDFRWVRCINEKLMADDTRDPPGN